ncbi:ABC transporter ATP-binding protein [Romboutsia ilealis]|uniref:ABC transporter ATP-binding protein n=1 Tax=Romboutsia faecis TaxID=2764597 RepID=A0ABR7JNW0_9FIRM|nr:ABC transporter ATP-binding protein [Romboutsia faecis]MBC5996616.1 ABC transporter ATP-binding protein [Romboutsia faecis]MRN24142.1 ABC transporter ATP-binding protein [Romboutsia ilealis]
MSAIKIKNLSKDFKDFSLNIKELDIKEGYVTGFIGPNGSGKTTTIKLIMNMLKKDNGTIKILGKEYKECDLSIKEQIGYVGDYSGYLHDAKISIIKKNISRFYKNWDEELYKKYINKFKLDEKKTYKELSKGQKKQFELAIVLSHHPKVIIMDEPTANLDPLVRNEFLEILQERIEVDNASVFYSTHITSDLDKVGDYLVFIYKGKIILEGDKYSILEEHSIVRGKKELLNNETKEIFISVSENSFGFEGLVRNKKEAYEIFGEEVVYDKPNLEDILTFYTRGK